MSATETAPQAAAPAKPAAQRPAAVMATWEKPTDKKGLESLAPFVKSQIELGLPRFLAGQGDRLLRCMLTACQVNPSLMECTPISLFAGTIQAAQLGLEIGGPRGEAYLVPFWNNKKNVKEAQLQVGYKGFIQLGYRSALLARVTPVTVREGDVYVVERGLNQKLIHSPKRNNKGKVTDYYVVAALTNGGLDFEEMSVDEAVAFRDRYASSRQWKSGPWYEAWNGEDPSNGFNEMALKTCIRRLFKRMPLSAEAQAAATLDEHADIGLAQNLPVAVMPEFVAPEPTKTQRLEQAVGAGKVDHPGSEEEAIPVEQPPEAEGEKVKAKSPPPPPAKKGGKGKAAPAEEKPKSELHKLLDELKAAGGSPALWVKDAGYTTVEELEEQLTEAQLKRLRDGLRQSIDGLKAEGGGPKGNRLFGTEDEQAGMDAIRG